MKLSCIFHCVNFCLILSLVFIGTRPYVIPLFIFKSMTIIQQQRYLGFDILDYIRIVVKVTKMLNFEDKKETFDQDEEFNFSSELFGFVPLMDGDNIVAIVCHRVIPLKMASKFVTKTFWLFHNSGYVKRSECKKSNPMAMFD